MDSMTEAREIDRALNRTRDPEEMRRLITRRKLVRAALQFEHAMAAYERSNPVGPIRDSFPFRLG